MMLLAHPLLALQDTAHARREGRHCGTITSAGLRFFVQTVVTRNQR
jgi:hypothetical protein